MSTDSIASGRWSQRLGTAALVCLAAALSMILVRTAWVSDDAYISFRTIDNFLHGYGLRWNVTERVQSFTHPLWLALLVAGTWVSGTPYGAAIVLSLVLTAATVGLMLIMVRDRPWQGCFLLCALAASKSFTDYSSSGLENVLSHVLLVLLMLVTSRPADTPRRAMTVGVLSSLIAVTRLDLTLMALPIALVSLRAPRRTLAPFATGQAPLIAWELFSVIYYGVPFPNTAYAKLATGATSPDLALQGLSYFSDSLARDPVTLFVIAAAILAGLVVRQRSAIPALAVAAYLIYIVRIGGDFMSGRFFSAPFVVSLCLLARMPWPETAIGLLAPFSAVVLLGQAAPRPPLLSDSSYHTPWQEILSASGIVDERGYYFQNTSWLTADGFRWQPSNFDDLRMRIDRVKASNPKTFAHTTIGMVGYLTGPDRHIIDVYGLCDPLLARLPAQVPWRIGHYQREIPAGYLESVDEDRNLVQDPRLAKLYGAIRLASRAPLWSVERWKAIVALNTGHAGR